jgi:hypothetical protein
MPLAMNCGGDAILVEIDAKGACKQSSSRKLYLEVWQRVGLERERERESVCIG